MGLVAAPPLLPAASTGVLNQSEALVAGSVVRIERRTTYYTGSTKRYMINHGTGVIIAEQYVNNHREYLLLSNEHVAQNHHVSGDSTSTLYIVQGKGVLHAPILLETLAADSKRDQALLRTVQCEESFIVPDYLIGSPPGDVRRSVAFTEGYGNGKFATLEGEILSPNAQDWGLRCYRIDVSVGAGQSGAPLVLIGTDKRLYLTGLVFCGNDRYTEATPLHAGKGILRQFASTCRNTGINSPARTGCSLHRGVTGGRP
jgi:hypothetical protein